MELKQRYVLQIRVEFDLVDTRRYRAALENELQVLLAVVAYADGLGQSLRFELFHLLPFRLVVFFLVTEEGSVNQIANNPSVSRSVHLCGAVQINIVQL